MSLYIRQFLDFIFIYTQQTKSFSKRILETRKKKHFLISLRIYFACARVTKNYINEVYLESDDIYYV